MWVVVFPIVIISVGIVLTIQPRKSGEVICRHYRRDPVIRLAGDAQFRIGTAYVVVLGLTLIVVGCFGLYDFITDPEVRRWP